MLMENVTEKRTPSVEELEAQFALELPEREMLGLVTVIIKNLLNHNRVRITVKNNDVAVQVCAVVQVIAVLVNTPLSCHIRQ